MARTGCGGFVDSVGGAITMMNMLKLNENSINDQFKVIIF
jgi:hypothetical protein